MISGLVLEHLKGLRLAMTGGQGGHHPVSSLVSPTLPGQALAAFSIDLKLTACFALMSTIPLTL